MDQLEWRIMILIGLLIAASIIICFSLFHLDRYKRHRIKSVWDGKHSYERFIDSIHQEELREKHRLKKRVLREKRRPQHERKT